ncbi:Hypothetical predicted protein [Pelobates cultripes]|uniref:Uncharacterized protein n=1 Tax=Pelobates cultripes TaxID=61616 RepID=A0AAD1R6E2_PELCU|nr:Hypothetical predicted protein [Pelobates cultripes]CAH2224839.1 Hypothetical predicted protein [Pelobates cultripes]
MRAKMSEFLDTIQATKAADTNPDGGAKERYPGYWNPYLTFGNNLVDKLSEMDNMLETHKLKITDMEDRSRRNNLRFQGMPETITNAELNDYLQDLFLQKYTRTNCSQIEHNASEG